jgi:SP family general alpha glucoside:H+ symporter-like MFS transporter
VLGSIADIGDRLPEPRGRSFAELDMLFEKGVSARKFATTKIDVFEEAHVEDTATFHRYEDEKVAYQAHVKS